MGKKHASQYANFGSLPDILLLRKMSCKTDWLRLVSIVAITLILFCKDVSPVLIAPCFSGRHWSDWGSF